MNKKIYERGTIEWVREQQKKKFDKKNKVIERWEKLGISNIFKDKRFDNEDKEDWHRFWSKVDIKDNINNCWNWTEGTNGKYGKFNLHDISVLAHRLAYILTKGNIQDGLQVQHLCNNRLCCNPNHLELGDTYKNMQYMIKCNRGNNAKGENNSNAILTEGQVREIYKLYTEKRKLHQGLKQWQIMEPLAKEFGISEKQVSNIINRKMWKNVHKSIS